MQITSMNGDNQLMLPEILDLAAADDFLELMRNRVNGEGPVRIDASAVGTLTLPCVQIILAAARSRETFSIRNPSTAFVGAFEDLAIDWMQYLDRSQEQEQVQEQIYDLDQGQNGVEVQQQTVSTDGMQDEASQIELNPKNEIPMSKRILTIDDSKTMRD